MSSSASSNNSTVQTFLRNLVMTDRDKQKEEERLRACLRNVDLSASNSDGEPERDTSTDCEPERTEERRSREGIVLEAYAESLVPQDKNRLREENVRLPVPLAVQVAAVKENSQEEEDDIMEIGHKNVVNNTINHRVDMVLKGEPLP